MSFVSLIVKVFDQSALSLEAKEEMYKLFPNARRAHLKTGGNFPYLCRSAEVNLYVQVGLEMECITKFQIHLLYLSMTKARLNNVDRCNAKVKQYIPSSFAVAGEKLEMMLIINY